MYPLPPASLPLGGGDEKNGNGDVLLSKTCYRGDSIPPAPSVDKDRRHAGKNQQPMPPHRLHLAGAGSEKKIRAV